MTLIRFSLKTSPPTTLTPKYAINCYNNTQKMTNLHTSSCYIQYGFLRNVVIFSVLRYCLVDSSIFKNNTQFLPFLIKIAQNLRTFSYKDVSHERIMSVEDKTQNLPRRNLMLSNDGVKQIGGPLRLHIF